MLFNQIGLIFREQVYNSRRWKSFYTENVVFLTQTQMTSPLTVASAAHAKAERPH